MRKTIPIICVLLLGATYAHAQKKKTIMGDAWVGVVESFDEATREIKIVNPDKKTETFAGVLEDGSKLKMIGASRELKMSDLKPGVRLRVFYKSKDRDVAGKSTKVNLINRLQLLGHDQYTLLREMLKLEPSIPVAVAESQKLSSNNPLKLYLAVDPENLDRSFAKWVDQWNKEEAAKHGRIEIVDDLSQADASLVVIWGKDESFFELPVMIGYGARDPRYYGFGTAYLVSKDDRGLTVLWENRIGLDMKEPQRAAPLLGKYIEKSLKARSR